MAGSGLPWKFINEKGKILDIYEQLCQIEDDGSMHAKSCLPALSLEQVIQCSYDFIDASFEKYHTVFQIGLHPVYLGGTWDLPTKEWLEALLAKCKQENLRMIGADEWLRFNDARRAVQFRNLEFDPEKGTLLFDFQGSIAAKGITLMLPAKHLDRGMGSVAVDNVPVEHSVTMLTGNQYALFVVDIKDAKWHRTEASYKGERPA